MDHVDHFEQILEEQFEYHRLSQESTKFIVAVEVRNPNEFRPGVVVSDTPTVLLTFDDGS